MTHDLQSSLDKLTKSSIVSLDFSPAFDLVNYQGLLNKLKSIGIGRPVFNIIKNFLTNHQLRGCGVPQGSVLCLLFFILYTADMWNNYFLCR